MTLAGATIQGALADLSEAVSSNPKNADALASRGMLLAELGDEQVRHGVFDCFQGQHGTPATMIPPALSHRASAPTSIYALSANMPDHLARV